MQFETPWWKLARFDTDWRVREAAQRFYITLCMVHGDDIEVAEDGDPRTMRFYEAADKNPLKRDVLRWYPPLRRLVPAAADSAAGVVTAAPASHLPMLESIGKFLLTQAENALAPWIVPLSGAYTPSGGLPHDLLTMLGDAAAAAGTDPRKRAPPVVFCWARPGRAWRGHGATGTAATRSSCTRSRGASS